MHFFIRKQFSWCAKDLKTGTMAGLSSYGLMSPLHSPVPVNRDNNVVAGLHPFPSLFVYILKLSSSVSI